MVLGGESSLMELKEAFGESEVFLRSTQIKYSFLLLSSLS